LIRTQPRANNQAERIANVTTEIGFLQNHKTIGDWNKQRGWRLLEQTDRPKRRF